MNLNAITAIKEIIWQVPIFFNFPLSQFHLPDLFVIQTERICYRLNFHNILTEVAI